MASESDRGARPPLDQLFGRVGTFEQLEDGSIVPVLSVEPAELPPDPTQTSKEGGLTAPSQAT